MRFTTYERVERTGLYVIKKDNRREAFSRLKLVTGIRKACEKRPIQAGIPDTVGEEIEAELYLQGSTEVATRVIGDMVMVRLKKFDHIAYIRFASVYREFTDITKLKEEVDSLAKDSWRRSLRSTAQLPLIQSENEGTQVAEANGK